MYNIKFKKLLNAKNDISSMYYCLTSIPKSYSDWLRMNLKAKLMCQHDIIETEIVLEVLTVDRG